MSVARTGSAIRIDSSANSGSNTSITVPADTHAVLMMAGGWPDATAAFFDSAAFTLDGVSFSFVDGEHADGSHNNTTAWAILDYTGTTGSSKTFAWDWGTTTAPNEGMSMFLIFLTADDPEFVHVKSFGGNAAESATGSTGQMDAASGDYGAAVSSHAGSASWTNATELFDATFNGAVQALAEQASPTGPFFIQVSGSDFVAITGLVISDEEPPPPPPWTRYTVQDNGTLSWATVGAANGDRVIVLFANDGGDDQSTPTSPEPLTRFDPGNVGTSVEFGAYYRDCDGTETGNIVSTTVASAANGFNVNTEEYGAHVFHFPAGTFDPSTPPELARAGGGGATGTPNGPTLSPSWGSAATIWLVALTRDDDDGISSLGLDYTENFLRTNSGANGPEIATSGRVNEASSEDAPAATVTGIGEEYIYFTIGVKPAPTGDEPVEITASPASISSSAVAASVEPGEFTVTATPASIASESIAASVEPAETTVETNPASIDSSAIEGSVSVGDAPVTITASPAVISSSAIAVDLQVATLIEVASATVASSAVAVDLTIAVVIEASPATISLEAQQAVIEGAITASPASAVVQAMPADLVLGSITITTSPATMSSRAFTGVKLEPQGRQAHIHHRRFFGGNRPRRTGWRKPPAWR